MYCRSLGNLNPNTNNEMNRGHILLFPLLILTIISTTPGIEAIYVISLTNLNHNTDDTGNKDHVLLFPTMQEEAQLGAHVNTICLAEDTTQVDWRGCVTNGWGVDGFGRWGEGVGGDEGVMGCQGGKGGVKVSVGVVGKR